MRDRHPGDVLRLVVGAAVLLLTASSVEAGSVGRFEADVFRVLNDLPLPAFFDPVVWAVMQLGNLAAVPATALAAALARRWRLTFDSLVAGGTIYVVAEMVKELAQRGRPERLLEAVNIVGDPATGLGYVSGHSAVAVALATVAAPYLGRRGRRVVWTLAVLVCLSRVYVGAHLPLDVVGGAALGWVAGAVAHLVLGAPEGHPSAARLLRVLADWSWSPAEAHAVGEPTRRSASFYVRDERRGDLFAKVVTRERRDDDLIYRFWRLLRERRVVHEPDFGPPLRQVEHEALMSLMAREAGVRTPGVVLARSVGNGGAVLVQPWVEGRPLKEVTPEELDERLLDDLLAQIERLHAAGIAHGELTTRNIRIGPSGEVWLTNFAESRAGADVAVKRADLAILQRSLEEKIGASAVQQLRLHRAR